MLTIREWLEQVSTDRHVWFVKRLSGNDTGATHSHQVGIYFPRHAVERLFPSVANASTRLNPKHGFTTRYDSVVAGRTAKPVVTWYNNSLIDPDGTRNEFRITRWGGRRAPVQDPEATGAIAVFAFLGAPNPTECRIWVTGSLDEETALEQQIGPVEPGVARLIYPTHPRGTSAEEMVEGGDPCRLKESELPPDWLRDFPAGEDIIELAVRLSAKHDGKSADQRLMRRRDCEYSIFKSVEQSLVMPRISDGFENVDEFVAFAGTVSNRRKSRSGRSLEMHLERIFSDSKLQFARGATVEGGKRPDFIFPSVQAYENPRYPSERLRMLAAKTTCKERWNQILNEASRIPDKHLLTLQEGVSEAQFAEMKKAGVVLVVPSELHASYPKTVRENLLSLEAFIADTAKLVA